MSSAEQTPHTGMSRSAEIRLVAGRELRTQLFKRASLVTAVVMLVLAVGGILVYARFSGGDDDPYRLGVIAPDAAASSAIASDLAQVKDSEGRTVSIAATITTSSRRAPVTRAGALSALGAGIFDTAYLSGEVRHSIDAVPNLSSIFTDINGENLRRRSRTGCCSTSE